MEDAENDGETLTDKETPPLGELNEFVRAGDREEDTESETSVDVEKEDDRDRRTVGDSLDDAVSVNGPDPNGDDVPNPDAESDGV